ncbi:MAG: LeuA allosteric (dimerization) domain, partial [Solirubrobacterales bacterium]|nr:LeuA allosteric (dimerization) domain [Solirubrobacterales bacterium]
VARAGAAELAFTETGDDTATAFAGVLARSGSPVEICELREQPMGNRTAAYALLTTDGRTAWGVGIDTNAAGAVVKAMLAAVNRASR